MPQPSLELRQLVAKLKRHRTALRKGILAKHVHGFGETIANLGYWNISYLDPPLPFNDLVKEAIGHYHALLEKYPKDAVAWNNVGVLVMNNGERSAGRRYFKKALELLPKDANIHENLRIADIYSRKAKEKWHETPGNAIAGKHTLVAYLDPQGM